MNKRISDLPAISTVDTSADPIPIVDVSDVSQAASGTTKRITISQIAATITSSDPKIITGTFADPNGNVTAIPGSIYFDLTTPASPVQWIKTTGTNNTGWI
jgi:hypothetical protein